MFINVHYFNIFLIPKYFQQYLKKENKLSCFLPNMKYGAAVYNVVPKNLRLLLHKWILHSLFSIDILSFQQAHLEVHQVK